MSLTPRITHIDDSHEFSQDGVAFETATGLRLDQVVWIVACKRSRRNKPRQVIHCRQPKTAWLRARAQTAALVDCIDRRTQRRADRVARRRNRR